MEAHLVIQLLYPFLELKDIIKFRSVCKSWCKLLTEKYPELHNKFFDRVFNRNLHICQNYNLCMAEFKHGRYRLYPNLEWYVHIKSAKVSLPIRLSRLARLIANKYGPEMWKKYWDVHLDTHRESGRSKCLQNEVPEIALIIFEVINRKIRMRAILEGAGKRRQGCFESCGNINVEF